MNIDDFRFIHGGYVPIFLSLFFLSHNENMIVPEIK